jgi:hypothetical protein
MIGVTMQRHPALNWDDGGKDISAMIQWLQANVAKYGGNPNRMFIWAHSAGNGPLGIYVGHPELHGPKGVGVKGAIFMSGNPVPDIVPQGQRGAGGALASAGAACGEVAGASGAITGPSAAPPAPARGTAPAGNGGGRGQQLDAATIAARSNLPGFKSTPAAIMLARAQWDPGVNGAMTASDIALHDELCKLDGPKTKDGTGHCPTMFYVKEHSHMSEVFSLDTPDETVGRAVLAWMKTIK